LSGNNDCGLHKGAIFNYVQIICDNAYHKMKNTSS
jgi:hypothetical protein